MWLNKQTTESKECCNNSAEYCIQHPETLQVRHRNHLVRVVSNLHYIKLTRPYHRNIETKLTRLHSNQFDRIDEIPPQWAKRTNVNEF